MTENELQPKEALSTSNDAVQETPEPEVEAQGKEQDQESQAQDQASDQAPEQANLQQEKKNRKPLVIILVAIIIAALALIAVFAMNIMESDSAKNAITNTLPENPAVTEQVIPSTWSDQSGFKAESVRIKEFDRGLFSSSASAIVEVDTTNGSYEATDVFDILCQKDGADWVITQADLEKTKYGPVGPISNEAILAHLPDILVKADEDSGQWGFVNPLHVADFFGADTEARVAESEYEDEYQSVHLELMRTIDGENYTGNIDVALMWGAALDQPDWKLEYAVADDDTYGAIGSVVRDGLPSDAMQDDQEEADAVEVDDGEFYVQFYTEMPCQEGSRYCFIGFANLASNTSSMKFSIISNEIDEVLYESPIIEPGQCLDYFPLVEPLTPGNHSVTVQYTAMGDGWRYIDTTESDDDCVINVGEGLRP